MATAEALLAAVGAPVDSELVRALVAADGLVASVEPEGWSVPRRGYLAGPGAGYQLAHALGRVTTVFVYAEPDEGFAAFPGPLLHTGLPADATRAEVRARLGPPERSGEETTVAGLGRQGAWDRFVLGAVRVHVQYAAGADRVRLVSLMAAAVAPKPYP